MSNTYSVLEVAKWFLSKESMTPKKLQKLTYYAQAWSNALSNRDLIDDTAFEAWAHGPVSPVLFNEYRDYKWNYIPQVDTPPVFDADSLDLLESVWITYGDRSANELEALTHTENPWKLARQRAGASEGDRCREDITALDMKNYYSSIYIGD